jgi:hypothetical protein
MPLNPLGKQGGDPLSGDGRETRAISQKAKSMFRSNLGSPTAHSRETPVVRTASTPKHGQSSKKHAHLSIFLTGDRKAESSDHPVWNSEEEKKGKKWVQVETTKLLRSNFLKKLESSRSRAPTEQFDQGTVIYISTRNIWK